MNSVRGQARIKDRDKAQAQAIADELQTGSRGALARAITLMESTRADHRQCAQALLCCLTPQADLAWRIGISGAPGVGKSTFIESFGQQLLEAGHRLAVLAVDPSSSLSGGSILGDKTRMEALSRDTRAFVRPSPTGGTLGGVARHTRDCITLCEAAGFDRVLVETVGVGQSESAVAAMTDMFIVLLPPGGGDELQGIKRGIMEWVDLLLVNKADGDLRNSASHTVADYRKALSLLRSRHNEKPASARMCSALTGEGIHEVLQQIEKFICHNIDSGQFQARRSEQARSALWSEITATLLDNIRQDERIVSALPDLERDVAAGILPPAVAASRLLDKFYRKGVDS